MTTRVVTDLGDTVTTRLVPFDGRFIEDITLEVELPELEIENYKPGRSWPDRNAQAL